MAKMVLVVGGFRGVRAPGGGRFGRKFRGKAKFGGFRGGEGGDCWGGARSTCQTSNPCTKITKSHKIQQIARKKILGLFLWGFSDLVEKQQNQASKWGDGTPRCE